MISGLTHLKDSNVTPQLDMTWGLKLSTRMSKFFIRSQNISLPLFVVTSRVIALLFKLTELYIPLVLSGLCLMLGFLIPSGIGAPAPRQTSGRFTVSI